MYQGGNSSAMASMVDTTAKPSWEDTLDEVLRERNWEIPFYMLLANVLRGYWVTDHSEITPAVKEGLRSDLHKSDDDFAQPWKSGSKDTINRLLDLIRDNQPVNWMMRNSIGGYNVPLVGHASISAFPDLEDRVVATQNRQAISDFYTERLGELRLLNLGKDHILTQAFNQGHRFNPQTYDLVIYGPSITPLKEAAVLAPGFFTAPRKVALLEINQPALDGAIEYLQIGGSLKKGENSRGAPFDVYRENYYAFGKSYANLRMRRDKPRVGVMLGRTITNDNMLGALKIFRESLDYMLVDFLNPVVGTGIEGHYDGKYLSQDGFKTLARNGVARYLPEGIDPQYAHIQGRLLSDHQMPLDIDEREKVPIQIYSLGHFTTKKIKILDGLVEVNPGHFLPGLNISAITPDNFTRVANAAGWEVIGMYTQQRNGCPFGGSMALLYNRESHFKPTPTSNRK